MKKLLSLWIAVLVTFGGMIGVNAYSYTDDYYYADEITVTLNGSKIYFDQPPIMQNDRTLVPMRKIFEAMGCNVEWDEESQMIDVWSGDENIMTLWVDYESMWTPEAYIELDVPPIVVNDRTLVPVRAISESIGALVDWDDYTQTVIITYNQKNSSSAVNFDSATDNICTHKNVGENCSIDERVYTNTGSDASHTIADAMNTYCKDCGEILSEYTREWEAGHDFEGSVCIDCGYVKKYSGDSEKSDETKNDSSSDSFQNINVNSGNLDIDDDGLYKTLHLKSEQSFVATNQTKNTIKINIQKNDYVNRFDYVIYKPDGNVAGVRYGAAISSYGNREIKPGYTIGIYNPNEYSIDIKASSDIFFPENKEAFEKIEIPLNHGIEIENDGQTSFDVHIYGNQYDTKSFDYVTYKADGNVAGVRYGAVISSYGNREIKAGYILGIYNYSGNNKDNLTVMKPKEQGRYMESGIFKIVTLNPGESEQVYNNTKTSFDIKIRSTAGAKKFDYTNYDSAGNASPTQFNKSISSYNIRTIKPDCSISISNSSNETIEIYVPQKIAN